MENPPTHDTMVPTAASAPAAPNHSPYTADFMKRLYCYAYRYLNNEAAAKDVVQSTLEALIAGERRFRGDSAYSTFIFAILRNKISDELRASMRYDYDTDAAQTESDDLTHSQTVWDELTQPEQRVHTARLLDALDAGMAKMSPQGRQVFLLSELYGYGGAEIASQLGLATGHIWVLLHRARKVLRTTLDQCGYCAPSVPHAGAVPNQTPRMEHTRHMTTPHATPTHAAPPRIEPAAAGQRRAEALC